MLKWSQAVLLALHATAILADREGETVSLDELAQSLSVSPDHLSKVMQRLVKCGKVGSVRGRSGGYRIEGDPSVLTLREIYEAIEGPLDRRVCTLHKDGCERGRCIFGRTLEKINASVIEYLSSTRMSEVASSGAVTG